MDMCLVDLDKQGQAQVSILYITVNSTVDSVLYTVSTICCMYVQFVYLMTVFSLIELCCMSRHLTSYFRVLRQCSGGIVAIVEQQSLR
jgi:hypothetical protein